MKGWIVSRTAKDGSKRYDAAWRVGPKITTRTFTKRKAAERYLSATVSQVHAGTYREIVPTTFKVYAEKWLEGLGGLKPSTVRDYRSMIESALIPAFGARLLASLDVSDINAFTAKRTGLKPRTLNKYIGLLYKLFEDAVESGHLAVNRLHRSRALRRPKPLRPEDEGEVEILDAAEVNQLLDQIEPHYAPLYVTLVSTGMRLGEALALQFGDVDRAARQIKVRRTLYRGAYYLPKSKRSKRSIDVGDQVLGAIRGIERDRYGDNAAPGEAPVFTTPNGVLINADNLRNRVWRPAIAAARVRHVTIHSLRHTYASLMIAQGENIKYVSEQMGHGSIQITVDCYGHLFPSEKRQAPARLEAQLAAGKGGASSSHPAERAATPGSAVGHGGDSVRSNSSEAR
jgi:integrase